MKLVVKIINGGEHEIEVAPDESIQGVKSKLASLLSIPTSQQRLMFKGKPLADSSNLSDNSVSSDTKIHLTIKKKDVESELDKELRVIGQQFVTDPDQFTALFNQNIKTFVNEMSLDDIERHDELRSQQPKEASKT